jgi:hypothetical protein
MGRATLLATVLLPAALAVGGCGGSSSHEQDKAAKKVTVTFPAYGGFPATTVPVTAGTAALCKRDAQAFTREAVTFLNPPLPTPADEYFVAARTQFYDFRAHRCDPAFLRAALAQRLNAGQRRALIAGMPFLGGIAEKLR